MKFWWVPDSQLITHILSTLICGSVGLEFLELLALTSSDSLFRLDTLSIARNEVLRAAIYGLVLH